MTQRPDYDAMLKEIEEIESIGKRIVERMMKMPQSHLFSDIYELDISQISESELIEQLFEINARMELSQKQIGQKEEGENA